MDDAFFNETVVLSSSKLLQEQFSCVRRFEVGKLKDSNDNQNDFVFVSTLGKIGKSAVSIGAPGPENLHSPPLNQVSPNPKPLNVSQPEAQNANAAKVIAANSSTSHSATSPVEVFHRPALRDPENVGINKTFGVLKLRCRLVNITDDPITRLNFRINGITNIPTSDGIDEDVAQTADVRLLPAFKESKPDSISNTSSNLKSDKNEPKLWEAVLDEPPLQPLGGGFNSRVTINLPKGGLMPGAACDVEWDLGVERRGHYQVILDSEHFHITFDGDTEDISRSTLLNHQNVASAEMGLTNGYNPAPLSSANNARPVDNSPSPSKTTTNPTQIPRSQQASVATAIIIFEGNTEDEFEPVEPTHSTLTISSFQVRGQTIALRFGGALDPQSASDIGHYTVQINGETVELESAQYDVGSNTVSLLLPQGAAKRGDTVFVQWVALKDTKGGVLNGQAGPAKVS